MPDAMNPSQKPQDGGAAFAHSGTDGPDGYPGTPPQAGMSLRDWFAGQAMIALIGNRHHAGSFKFMSELCYAVADEMLAAREAKP